MKMYDLHRLVQDLPRESPELEIPLQKAMEIPDIGNSLERPVSEPKQLIKSNNQIRSVVVLIAAAGVAICLMYWYVKLPKNNSYQSITQRRKNKSKIIN